MTGRLPSVHQTEHDPDLHPKAWPSSRLERPREELRARINQRVVQMFEAGLIDEVLGPR